MYWAVLTCAMGGLQQCVDGVEEAMHRHDYEQAAQHIHRYLQLDPALLADVYVHNVPVNAPDAVRMTSLS